MSSKQHVIVLGKRLAWAHSAVRFSVVGRIAESPLLGAKRMFVSSSAVRLKDYPPHTLYPMPALSPTMEMGTIAQWEKKEGEEFIAGDVLCSIDTDKASVAFEAQDDGIIAKILREGPNATDIPIGTPICVVVEEEADVPAFADFELQDTPSSPSPDPEQAEPSVTAGAAPVQSDGDASVLMPSARHLSRSQGLDASVLSGTGKGGRVTKGDVIQALENAIFMPPLAADSAHTVESMADVQPPATPVSAAPPTKTPGTSPNLVPDLPLPEAGSVGVFEDVPNNNMRKVIARRLTESKRDVPHYYTSIEVELDRVLVLRKDLANNHDVKVSVNDVIIRCCSLALRDVPEVNATFDEKAGEVKLQPTIDVSVAVATPTGLITPIVPNTDQLGLAEITSAVRDLAGRAREGKLLPTEYQGGTFCISNLGMFGIDEFSAVINPPQAAILAVGGGTRRVVSTPFEDGDEQQTKPSVKTMMTARLSADRRVVDEATASLFLSAFRQYINNPELLLL